MTSTILTQGIGVIKFSLSLTSSTCESSFSALSAVNWIEAVLLDIIFFGNLRSKRELYLVQSSVDDPLPSPPDKFAELEKVWVVLCANECRYAIWQGRRCHGLCKHCIAFHMFHYHDQKLLGSGLIAIPSYKLSLATAESCNQYL